MKHPFRYLPSLFPSLLPDSPAHDSSTRIAVKVVVVTMFENDDLSVDGLGEYRLWIQREAMNTILPFPQGEAPLHMNEDGVLAVLTGGGLTNAAATITALGNDPRFDFTKAYWLIAGIAGTDPEKASLGTAAWARWVVDGDLLYEIDAREIPENWPYGLIALGAKEPNTLDGGWTVDNIVFKLNEGLTQWAYQLTKDTPLPDRPSLQTFREKFAGFPEAQQPPRVILGDSLSSSTYWHGEKLTRWAHDWVKLHTAGDGDFAMTNMEDSATLTAIRKLSRAGLADLNRVLVLRTASNFSRPPLGKSPAWTATAEYPEGGLPAFEAAHHVGSIVVHALVENWSTCADNIPSALG